jgi:hypothetical protein
MRVHLLKWTLGPAFFGAVVAASGFGPQSAFQSGEEMLRGLGLVAGFVGLATVWLILLTVAGHWLMPESFPWAVVRLGVKSLAVRSTLLFAFFVAVIGVYQFAGFLSGGWGAGWRATPVGIGVLVGALLGLAAGLAIARIRRAERLGTVGREPG